MSLRVPDFVFAAQIVVVLWTLALFFCYLAWIAIKGWKKSNQQSFTMQLVRLMLWSIVSAFSVVGGIGIIIEVVYFISQAVKK